MKSSKFTICPQSELFLSGFRRGMSVECRLITCSFVSPYPMDFYSSLLNCFVIITPSLRNKDWVYIVH